MAEHKPTPPEECTSMDQVRREIDHIDAQLVELLAERFRYVDRAWQLKMGTDEGATVPWRIQQVIDKVRARAEEKGLPPALADFDRSRLPLPQTLCRIGSLC